MNEEISVAGVACADETRVCVVNAHPDGFGFAEWSSPEGERHSLFLSPKEMRQVFAGDVIEVKAATSPKTPDKLDGIITAVLARSGIPVVAIVRNGILWPENGLGPRLTGVGLPEDGWVVAVSPDLPPSEGLPSAFLVGILGRQTDPDIKTKIALCRYGIPSEWMGNEEVEASRLVRRSDTSASRRDLRGIPFVTIDGESTRDFDDAVHATPCQNGFRLLVAVADVAEYVRPQDVCDRTASTRATSVYFPDRVVPMLPRALSDGVCSLSPGVDKLVLCCEMIVDMSGVIKAYEFFEGVMRSHARLTYQQASAMQSSDQMLNALATCSGHLASQKSERGTMDFDMKETKLVIADGKIVAVSLEERTPAHHWIEDCMLAANTCAADFMIRHGQTALFRNHAAPCAKTWEESKLALFEAGISLGGRLFDSVRDFADLLAEHEGSPSFWLVQSAMLKAFRPAEYGSTNEGHYSLNLASFLHFTSPIRRYPDLIVHRLLKGVLRGETPSVDDFAVLAKECALAQRRANVATREVRQSFLNDWFVSSSGSHPAVVKSVGERGARVMLKDCGYETVVKEDGLQVTAEVDLFFAGFDRSGRKPIFASSPASVPRKNHRPA